MCIYYVKHKCLDVPTFFYLALCVHREQLTHKDFQEIATEEDKTMTIRTKEDRPQQTMVGNLSKII